jgi:hypothetical protein
MNTQRLLSSLPLEELSIDDSVGEPPSGDLDTFQHSIASQLIQYNSIINAAWSLCMIWNDASNEMRESGSQRAHQLLKLFLQFKSTHMHQPMRSIPCIESPQ